MDLSISDIERFLAFERRVNSLSDKMEEYMAHLDTIIEKVTLIEDRGDAIISLVQGLAEEIRHNKADQAALEELANRLDMQASEITAAIDENTPAPPPEPPTP